jgi:hypothetical protein
MQNAVYFCGADDRFPSSAGAAKRRKNALRARWQTTNNDGLPHEAQENGACYL